MPKARSARSRLRPSRRLVPALLVLVSLGGGLKAQTANEHAAHHPQPAPTDPRSATMANGTRPAAGAPSMPPPEGGASMATATPEAPSTQASPGMAMGMEMGDDMGMGRTPRRELYPSLMQMPSATPSQRAEIEAAARTRIATGRALIVSGVDALRTADRKQDLPGLRASAAQLREGVAQLESGVAALHGIAQGQPPRDIALDWFKTNMGMLPARDMVAPHGVFGLSWFHYFVMSLLLAFATAMVWMNARKMQRARALAVRLAPASRRADNETEGDAAGAPLPALAPVSADGQGQRPPSRSNSWSGLLRVDKIFEESPNVRTLRLVDPSGGEFPFRYLPGQFVTFTIRPNDKPVKRSYTISSSPTRLGYCEVTVKREPRGTVSGYLHDMHEGDTIQVTGPSGSFTFVGSTANSVVLMSGGVGITPMMSVVRYLTDHSWRGDIFFVYACRTEQDVIFREELEYLSRRHRNLHLTITASEPTSDAWPYEHGYVTKELLQGAIPYITTRHVHLCGPKPMMDAVKRLLSDLEVPDNQVVTEVFVGKERIEPPPGAPPSADAGLAAAPAVPGAGVAVAKFMRSGQTAMLPADKTILEAAEDVGVNIEYSCRVGTCGACKVKLLEGEVTMEVDEALDEQDRQNNIILACQAKASADVSIDA